MQENSQAITKILIQCTPQCLAPASSQQRLKQVKVDSRKIFRRTLEYPEVRNSSADGRATFSKPYKNQIWLFPLTEMRCLQPLALFDMENLEFLSFHTSWSSKKKILPLSFLSGEKGQKLLMQKWRGEAVWEEEQLHQEKQGLKEFDLLIQEKMRIMISTEANSLGRFFS